MGAVQDHDVVRAEAVCLSYVLPVWEAAGCRFVTHLREMDPALGSEIVPGLKWTVAETAAHMLSVVRRGTTDFRRSETLTGIAELNDTCIAETEERDLRVLADLIEAAIAKLEVVLRATSEEDAAAAAFPLHVGVIANVPTALSYCIFDFLGHGYDITLPTGNPAIPNPAEAGITLHAIFPALRPWVREDVLSGPPLRATFSFVPDVALVVRSGQGVWEVAPVSKREVDSEVDASELFLAIAGRVESADANVRHIAEWFFPI